MKYIERLLLLIAAVILAGTNKCQEDYFFAVQTKISLTPTGTITVDPDATETATPTATSGTPSPTATDDDDDDGDIDPTNTPQGSPGNQTTATATASPTITPTTGALTLMHTRNASGLLTDLESLDNPEDPQPTAAASDTQLLGNNALGLSQNWLGNMYKEDDASGEWNIDSDSDGFVDGLENALGSDPHLAKSIPVGVPKTRLTDRLAKVDRDADGLSDQQEQAQGGRFDIKDSDGDGVSDGLEFLSGSNSLNKNSLPVDTDKDGLSDDYELAEGINPKMNDSDGDGLPDGLEIEIGSNPLVKDTDQDGISDAREYQIGGDPLISDFPKNQ